MMLLLLNKKINFFFPTFIESVCSKCMDGER